MKFVWYASLNSIISVWYTHKMVVSVSSPSPCCCFEPTYLISVLTVSSWAVHLSYSWWNCLSLTYLFYEKFIYMVHFEVPTKHRLFSQLSYKCSRGKSHLLLDASCWSWCLLTFLSIILKTFSTRTPITGIFLLLVGLSYIWFCYLVLN